MVVDIERIIALKIERTKKLLSPQINPANVNHNRTIIEVLQSASRDEVEVKKLIDQKKAELEHINNTIEARPLHNELDALEWLHALVIVSKIDPISAQRVV